MHRAAGVDVQSVLRCFGVDALSNLGQRQTFFKSEPHVFSHCDGVKQVEVLKHHADAQSTRLFRVANVCHLAVENHLAGIGLDGAVNNFHQRRLARTVFTQNRMGLAWHDRKRNTAVCDDARVGFGDTGELQSGLIHEKVSLFSSFHRPAATALTRSRSHRLAADAWVRSCHSW